MSTELETSKTKRPCENGERTSPKWRDLPVHYLILEMDEFVVFLDDEYDVDWKTSEGYDRAHEGDWKDIGAVLNRVTLLQAYPVAHLATDQRLGFRRMLGESVARALEGNTDAATSILEKAEAFVTARNHEHARLWYLSASSLTALTVGMGALGIWTARGVVVALLGKTLVDLALASGAGAVGALLSVYRRTTQVSLDPSAGRQLHYFQGASHIVVGAIGGCVVWLLAASGLISPQALSPAHGRILCLLLCLVGGASERLVPSLMDRFETSVARSNSSTGPAVARRKAAR